MKRIFLFLSSMLFLNNLFAIETLLENQIFFYFVFTIFIFALVYAVLSKLAIFSNKKSLPLIIALTTSFLVLIIIRGPIAKYFLEVLLPFILLTVFILMLIYVFFSSVGIKFGSGENEEGFINIVSTIAMWVGIVIFIIIFLAALREMGYSIVNRMIQPSILGILVFALVMGFIIMTIEK